MAAGRCRRLARRRNRHRRGRRMPRPQGKVAEAEEDHWGDGARDPPGCPRTPGGNRIMRGVTVLGMHVPPPGAAPRCHPRARPGSGANGALTKDSRRRSECVDNCACACGSIRVSASHRQNQAHFNPHLQPSQSGPRIRWRPAAVDVVRTGQSGGGR